MSWLSDAAGLLAKGGLVMIPLLTCSVISVAVLLERHLSIQRARTDANEAITGAEDALYSGNIDRAATMLGSHDSAVARVLAAGVQNWHLGERCVERAMEEQGARETAALTCRLGWLDTIITIAPLLGLLGTVTGMISAFNVIATKQGISTPTAITGGVAEALIATATGLAIAIFTLVGYNALQEKIKGIVAEIEARGNNMLNVIADSSEVTSREIKKLSA